MGRNMRVGLVGLIALVALACSGVRSRSPADCEAIAKEIRDRAGPRGTGVCSSTIKEDVERFGSACANLEQCDDDVSK